MRIAIPFVLIFLLLFSCQSDKQLIGNVSSLSLRIDRNTPLNIGSNFSYTVIAELESGETRRVKNDEFVQFPDDQLIDVGEHKAQINQPLHDFKTDRYPFEIGVQIGAYSAVNSDTLLLNFKGPIKALWRGSDGQDGQQPRASTATLFGRDGLNGKQGRSGEDGEDGRHFTGYLWEDQKELRLLLICDSTGSKYCYRSADRDSIIIDLRGGNAGDGSMGGTGGDGKPGKAGKNPGNGADGGLGGNGGSGGDGGSLLLFIHPSAAYMNKSIRLLNSGGKGGFFGVGGAPGKGGNQLKGQPAGSTGKAGENGINGEDGVNGPSLTISKVAFDYSTILKVD